MKITDEMINALYPKDGIELLEPPTLKDRNKPGYWERHDKSYWFPLRDDGGGFTFFPRANIEEERTDLSPAEIEEMWQKCWKEYDEFGD